jgi:hypothetical protein
MTDLDREWMHRYPGSWQGPLSMSRACFICGKPGYTVPAPPQAITVFDTLTTAATAPPMRTGDTCPGHEYAVRRFLYEHPELPALVHQKPR